MTPLIEAHGQGCNLALGATSADVACANGVNTNLTTKSGGVPNRFQRLLSARWLCRYLRLETVVRGGFGISFFPPVTETAKGCATAIT